MGLPSWIRSVPARRVRLPHGRHLAGCALAAFLGACGGGDGAGESPGTVQVVVQDTALAPADAYGVAFRIPGGTWVTVPADAPGHYTLVLPAPAEAVEVAIRCDGAAPRSRVYVHAFGLSEGRKVLVSYCRRAEAAERKLAISARLPAGADRLAVTGSGSRVASEVRASARGEAHAELPTAVTGDAQDLILLAGRGEPEVRPLALAVLRDVDPEAAGTGLRADLSAPGLRLAPAAALDLVAMPPGWEPHYRLHLLTARGAKLVVQERVGVYSDLLAVPRPAAGGAAAEDWLELYAESRAGDGRRVYTRLHRRVGARPSGFVMDFPVPFWSADYRPRFEPLLVFDGLTDSSPGHLGYRFRVERPGAPASWELNVSDGFLRAMGTAHYVLPDLAMVPGFGDAWQPTPGEPLRFDAFSGSFEGTDWQAYILAPEPIGNRRHRPIDGQRLRVSRIQGVLPAQRKR